MPAPHILTIFTRYGRLGASSRMRAFLYHDALRARGWRVSEDVLLSDSMLAGSYTRQNSYSSLSLLKTYARRTTRLGRHPAGLLWIEKEALPWTPAWFEKSLLRGQAYVLDYDDAIFHNYDLHPNALVRRWLGRRIDRLMAGARLVMAGNDYLAERARQAGAPWVEVVPTVVDLDHYPRRDHEPPVGPGAPARVVWIGSPTTVAYLEALAPVFQKLAAEHDFVLRVIGGRVSWPGVAVECVPWSEATEAARIAECHLGIMPLVDGPWERGKCGYKLIQYMACGLPVVAAPVGVNAQIVVPNQNGLLAASPADWHEALLTLLKDSTLRLRLGQAGRTKIEQEYSLQVMANRVDALLARAIENTP